jgi:RNA polymerase sigma-70 factor (ECF subfamily)
MSTDQELLAAWRAGDQTLGNDLFQRHFAAVHRYFANKVGSERDVEDLIQRTFLAVLEAHDRFAGNSSFKTWVLGIAHNLLCEHYRGQRRGGGPAIDLSEISVRDLCAGPSTLLGRRRDEQALLEALRSLPFDAQVVLELYYWERMTGAEVGDLVGIPENTARSRLRKAKQLLLDALRTGGLSDRKASDEDDLERWADEVRQAAFSDA